MEIVPIESAYPGYGELVVSISTLHCLVVVFLPSAKVVLA